MFPQIPSDLSALSDDDLAALLDQLVAAFNEAIADPSSVPADDVAELSAVADSVERLRSEQSTRDATAAARADEIAQLASRVNASDTQNPDENENGDAEPVEPDPNAPLEDEPTGAPGEPAEPAEGGGEPPDAAQSPEAIAAASNAPAVRPRPTLANVRAGAPARTRPRPEAPRSVGNIIASADVPGITPGAPVRDMRHVAELMVERHRTLGNGNGDSVSVVRFTREFPAERHLSRDLSPDQLAQRLASFDSSPQGLVAAGGLCAPVDNYYDQEIIADASRPVRDALGNFQADRGGLRFMPPPTLASVTGGVARVTAAQDLGGTTKTCFTVTCPTPSEVDIAAIYACLAFGNFGSRAWPEAVEAWTKLSLAKQAQVAETALLDAIAAGSLSVTAQGQVGAGRELFALLGRAAAGFRSRHRMKADAPLTVLLPAWTLNLVQSDFARTFTDETGLISMAPADLERLFGTRGLNVGWYLDSKTGGGQVFGGPAGGRVFTDAATTSGSATVTAASGTFSAADVGKAITGAGIPANTTITAVGSATSITISNNATATATGVAITVGVALAQYPTRVYAYMFPAGNWLFLDGGTLDLGVVRDSALNSTNQFQIFSETFENAALIGPESDEIVLSLSPDGSYAAAKTVVTPINS